MSPESEESTFTELIQELLDAIRAKDEDEEMSLRADIKSAFKLISKKIERRMLILGAQSGSTLKMEI